MIMTEREARVWAYVGEHDWKAFITAYGMSGEEYVRMVGAHYDGKHRSWDRSLCPVCVLKDESRL